MNTFHLLDLCLNSLNCEIDLASDLLTVFPNSRSEDDYTN